MTTRRRITHNDCIINSWSSSQRLYLLGLVDLLGLAGNSIKLFNQAQCDRPMDDCAVG